MILIIKQIKPTTTKIADKSCDTLTSIPKIWKGRYRLSVLKPSTNVRSKPYHTRYI